MLEILERLCAGEGRGTDLAELAELADRVSRTSLCGLGQTAPNPVLTTLRYFARVRGPRPRAALSRRPLRVAHRLPHQ
jgi:NADH:ubiquinone oxidoreductase subunit F (NADH-binding)